MKNARKLALSLLTLGLTGTTAWANPELPDTSSWDRSLSDASVVAQASTQPVRRIKVDKFLVEGNTLLKDDEIRNLIGGYEGKELSLAEMKEVARLLTVLYQRQGFYLVRAIVPVQTFDNSQVKLQVVEGKIGQITVEGADNYSAEFIKRRFQVAVPDGNFRSDDFQRAMLLLNELPDLKVKAVLKPGKENGTADVVLKVQDATPVHFGLDYNNYGTPQTGENRVGLNFDAGNLVSEGDQLALRGVIGFPSRGTSFFQVQYATPVNLNGTEVHASYANGAFAISEGLGAILDVRGTADIFTVGLTHPLERDLDFSSNLAASIVHKDIRNDFFGGAAPFTRDQYTAARLGYSADWRGASGRTYMALGWTQGLGGTSGNDPLVSRLGASGGFSKFNLDVARVQTIDQGLYGVLRGSAQFATTPLYLAEQYAMGGPDTVRGYQQAELLGDNAYLFSAELRWSPIQDQLDLFQVAFFVDHGGVSLKRRLPGDLPNGSSLTGAGLGFRFGLSETSNLRLDLGFPISPTNNRNGSSPAVYAGLQTRF